MPEGARVTGKKVEWISRGKKLSGVLTSSGRVRCQSDKWLAKYADENGKQKSISTGTSDKAEAMRILVKHENDVTRIKAGVMSRDEITQAQVALSPIAKVVDRFETSMISNGRVKKHIKETIRNINTVFDSISCNFKTLSEIEKTKIESWIAGELTKSTPNTPRTINSYVASVRSFLSWCVENKYIVSNPLKKIKKLNEEIGRKKNRRSLTEDELKRLFEIVHVRKYRKKGLADEHELIYRLLAGTGLRSTELSLATPSQFDFERNRFTVVAVATKNKRSDVLPIRPELAARLKEWVDKHGIKPASGYLRTTKTQLDARSTPI